MADIGIKLTAQDQTQAAFSSVGKSLATLQGGAASVSASLASLGAGISVAGFVAFTKAAIDSLDALNDVKDATGASIENISALEDIARRTGTSFDTVGSSLIKLNQTLNSAKADSPAALAIEKIGLSVKDLKALDPAEAFRQIAVGLSGFADDGNKARISQELFGKSLKEIAPLLNDVASAGALVGSVTAQQAQEAENLNKQLFALQANALGASRTLASEFLPTLNAIGKEFLDASNSTGSLAEALGGGVKIALEAFAILGANVAFVLKGVGREIAAIAAQTVALATLDLKGFTAISDAVREDGVRARKELDELERRILGAGQKFNPNNESAAEAARLARGTTRASIGGLPDTSGDKAAASAAAAEFKKQADLIATLSGVTADYQETLTRLQSIKKSGQVSDEKYLELVNALIEKQPMVIAQRKAEADALKGEVSAYQEFAKAQEAAAQKALEAYQKTAESSAQRAAALEDEEAAAALATATNVSLAVAVEQLGLSRAREAQAKALANGADGATLLALQQEIADREKIVKLIASKEGRDAAADAAKNAASEWQKAADQIESSLTDALFRGFESGKDLITNLRDTIVNTFKTMVLRPIVSAVVNPVAGVAASALGFSGAANAGSAVSGATTLAQYGALAGTFGSSVSAGFAATVNSFGAATGVAIEGGLASIAAGTSSAITAGIGQLVGALGPYALAAVAIAGLFGAFKGEYVQSLGESVATITADKVVKLGGSGGNNDVSIGGGLNIRQTEQSDTFVNSLATTFLSAAEKLGIVAENVAFGAGFNNSDGGKFAVEATIGGQRYDPGQVKYTDENLQLEASRAVFFALQSSALPGYLSELFDGITASTATADQINQTLAYAQALKQVRDGLTETREPLQILKDNVAESLAALGTTAETFKSDFVRAIDAGIDQRTLAKFQQLGAGIQELAAQTDGAGKAVDKFAATNARLQDKLDLLTGTRTERDLELRDATEDSTRALLRQIFAQEDLKKATDAAADAARDAATQFAQETRDAIAYQDNLRAAEIARVEGLRDSAQALRDEATQRYLAAQNAVTRAQESLANVLRSTVGGLQDLIGGLEGGGTPTQNLAGARQNVDNIVGRINAGDTGAISEFAPAAKKFLELSKGFSATIQDYQRDQAKIRNIANAGIAAGKAQLSGLPGAQAGADADPIKAATAALQKAYVDEANARNLAIATQANLTNAEADLATRYKAIIAQLPGAEGGSLADYFESTLDGLSGKALKDAALAALKSALPKIQGGDFSLVAQALKSLEDLLPGEIGGDFSLLSQAQKALQDLLPDLTGQDLDLVVAAEKALSDWLDFIPQRDQDFSLLDAAYDAITAILPKVTDPGALDFIKEVRDSIVALLPDEVGGDFSLIKQAQDALAALLPNVEGGALNLAQAAYDALSDILPVELGGNFSIAETAAQAIANTLPTELGGDFSMAQSVTDALGTVLPSETTGDFSLQDTARLAIEGTLPTITGGGFNFRELAEAAINRAIESSKPAADTILQGTNGLRYNVTTNTVSKDVDGITSIASAAAVAAGFNEFGAANGVEAATARAIELGATDSILEYLRKFSMGVPKFASGGMFAGGLRIVGENGPELEATGPSRIFDAAATASMLRGGGNADLVTEMRALRAEVQRLREDNSRENNAIIAPVQKTAKITDQWNIDGQPAVRT